MIVSSRSTRRRLRYLFNSLSSISFFYTHIRCGHTRWGEKKSHYVYERVSLTLTLSLVRERGPQTARASLIAHCPANKIFRDFALSRPRAHTRAVVAPLRARKNTCVFFTRVQSARVRTGRPSSVARSTRDEEEERMCVYI